MKRPAFQFYPGDWQRNAKLRRCSAGARGVWIDIMCLLHDSDEYGVLRWPLKDLAQASGASIALVKELVAKGVLKGADADAAPYIFTPRHAGKDGEPVALVVPGDGPVWYCSRFVRDEWVRLRRGTSSQFSSDNQPPKPAPIPPIGERQGDGPSSASSSATTKEKAERKRDAASLLATKPDDVPDAVWNDFQTLRRAKRSPVTITALAGIVREAGKAGIPVGEALAVCCRQGWQGFNAEWYANLLARDSPRQQAPPRLTASQQMQQNVIGAIRSPRTIDVETAEVFSPRLTG